MKTGGQFWPLWSHYLNETLGMVVNISKPTATVYRPLDYNEQKVAKDVASLIAGFNVDGMTPEAIEATFRRYEKRNLKTKKIAFHMSINPTQRDNMDEDSIVKFACKLMEGLGYGKQPFLIYRHNDIDRVHYHVVSIRTDINGKKIKNYLDWPRCNQLMKELQPEFGYYIGKEETQKQDHHLSRFDPSNGDVQGQLIEIYNECLQYNFTSVEQLRMILRKFHVGLDVRTGKKSLFYLKGLDNMMRPCTREFSDRNLRFKLYEMYQVRAMECLGRMAVMNRERSRITGCARGPLVDATSELHFKNMMRKKGIDVSFERDHRSGQITGANFVDHVSKCAFKLSEFGTILSLEKLQEADVNWPHKEPTSQSRATNLAGEMLLGFVSGDGSKAKGRDMRDDKELEFEEKNLFQVL